MALIKSIFLEIPISACGAAYLIIMNRGVQDERIKHEFISSFFRDKILHWDMYFGWICFSWKCPHFCDGIPKKYCKITFTLILH